MNKAFIALAIGGFGIGLTEFVIMGILPDVANAIDITIPQAGHFISAYALGVVVGAPIFTAIGGKMPAHKALIWLMVWFTIFNTLSALANSYWLLLVSRFLAGLPHGAFFGIGAVVASKLAKPGKSAQAIAIMFSGLTIANVLGVPSGTYLSQNFGWNFAFYMVGFVGILAVLANTFWMPKLPVSSQHGLKEELQIFKRLELWLVILLTTIGTGGFFAWYSYIAPLITDVAGHGKEVVSYAMILAGLGMTLGNLLGAKLADKLSPIKASSLMLGVMAIVLILNTFLASNPTLVLVMTFVIGVVAFCIVTPVQLTMINSAKGSEMMGSSVNQSAFNMGNASGAYLAGLPIAAGMGYTSADWVGTAMAASGVVVALIIMQLRKQQQSKNKAYELEKIR
tara:strand:+ start:8699 stop:9886 length:1188 start_codon:yes stop_codon:yes gene_type:complete